MTIDRFRASRANRSETNALVKINTQQYQREKVKIKKRKKKI